mgnify:CR=1 FL=1
MLTVLLLGALFSSNISINDNALDLLPDGAVKGAEAGDAFEHGAEPAVEQFSEQTLGEIADEDQDENHHHGGRYHHELAVEADREVGYRDLRVMPEPRQAELDRRLDELAHQVE